MVNYSDFIKEKTSLSAHPENEKYKYAERELQIPAFTTEKHAGKRVFIIDDNVDMTDSLREMLELEDYIVDVAYDGSSGIAGAKVFNPDILICDIGLPDMDGYEVARALRMDGKSARIFLIALTGYTLPADLKKAQAAGFDQHLSKPINPDELLKLLTGL